MTTSAVFGLWIRRGAIALGVLLTWLLTSAGIMVTSELAPGALVVFPARDLVRRLPDSVRILDSQPYRLLVTSDEAGYVKALYDAGAKLVLPARKNGCVALRVPGALPIRPGALSERIWSTD